MRNALATTCKLVGGIAKEFDFVFAATRAEVSLSHHQYLLGSGADGSPMNIPVSIVGWYGYTHRRLCLAACGAYRWSASTMIIEVLVCIVIIDYCSSWMYCENWNIWSLICKIYLFFLLQYIMNYFFRRWSQHIL